MRPIDIVRLLSLAAIWGSSFIFMRVLAPVLGPLLTADFRVLCAGAVLLLYYAFVKFNPHWKKNWKHYLIIGMLNAGIPFVLYCYAALHLPASYEAILNATTPLFGAVFSWLWLNEQMTTRKIVGISTAVLGVAIVVNLGATHVTQHFVYSVLCCLGATICYGLASVYIKKFASTVEPLGIAGCSQLMAGIALLPFSITQGIYGKIDAHIIFSMLGLAVMCSAVAFVLYYQLIADVGPTKTLTVAFLIPIFGIFWGILFLNEKINTQIILGTFLILIGTWFVLRKPPDRKAS